MEYKFLAYLKTNKAKILGIVFILIHISVLSVVVIKTRPWMTGDSKRYLSLSDELKNNYSYGLATIDGFEPEGMRSPGYPVFVLASKTLLDNSDFGIILIQIILYFASIWLVWRVTCKLFNKTCGLIFLLVSSIYPFIMYSVGQISPEIPTVFLFSLSFYLLLDLSLFRVAVVAALIAITAYFRPNLVFLNGILFFSLIFVDYRDWRKPLWVFIMSVLIMFPFTLRNYLVFGRPTPLPIVSGSGNSLMFASWMSKVSIDSVVKYNRGEINEEIRHSGMLEQIAEINRQVGVPENTIFSTVESYPTNKSKIQANELLTKYALQNISEDRIGFSKTVISNSIRMWFTSHIPEEFPLWLRATFLIEGILVFLLAVFGLLKILRERTKQNEFIMIYLTGIFGYFIITLSWLHTEARYTITVRLFVLMLASYTIWEFWKLIRNLLSKRVEKFYERHSFSGRIGFETFSADENNQ